MLKHFQMRKIFSIVCLFSLLLSFTKIKIQATAISHLSSYVNPFVGATTNTKDAKSYHGLGKTFPGVTAPFGMVQVSPNTITGGDNGSGYSYEHTSIEGFAFTQMSGIGWYGDLGNFLVMPTIGKLKTFAGTLDNPDEGYRSRYDKHSEVASAGYYSVALTDYGIHAEMTALPHSGMLRFTFPKSRDARIQIDLARRVGGTSVKQYIEVVNDHTIKGWMKCPPEGGGWGNGNGKADYTVYFFAEFSKSLKSHGIWTADIPDSCNRKREDIESENYRNLIRQSKVIPSAIVYEGKHIGFYADFGTRKDEKIILKSGISFTCMENAEENLYTEMQGWDFDKVYRTCIELWDKVLAKITVDGGTEEEKAIFYTALYHTKTLEYAYSDWYMARLAEWLDKKEDSAYFDKRAQSYTTVFGPDFGWFRPRDVDGNFMPLPETDRLDKWYGYGCVESNVFQQGWFVPHDVPGLVRLLGGRDKALVKLNEMFEKAPRDYLWNSSYNHANEPVHHMPFLFNHLGAPWLTQKWTRNICRNAYHNSVNGLVGNEDVGQMSAWYVLAAVGIHPICPGDTHYEITSPVFNKIDIKLDSRYAFGTQFTIEAVNNSPENIYIQNAVLNGKPYHKCYLTHDDIVRGGKIILTMGACPTEWGH